jgi:hypothetical protein
VIENGFAEHWFEYRNALATMQISPTTGTQNSLGTLSRAY